MNKATVINQNTAGDTVINPENKNTVINNGGTYINSEISENNNMTIVNSELLSDNIESGTVLNDRYILIRKLDVNSGEADLFLCEHKNTIYVAKIYHRKVATKPEVNKAISEINSENVAKIFETGIIYGHPFEIIPYYKEGSLSGKTFTFEQLQRIIIPALNKALFELHSKGIIHKDLKPSNIMLTDSGSIAVIDFGISSVREQGNTVLVTKTGMTPEYSAPETFRSVFLKESDYYSMGITVYELFCGKNPYADMSAEEVERFTAVQKLPLPDNMPVRLKELITGLTYFDITNRKDKSNPNRRWVYEEVEAWINGEDVPVPNSEVYNDEDKIPPYKFLGEKYTSIPMLTEALLLNWEEGKKQLFRGLLSGYFKKTNPEIAGFCIDAEEALSGGKWDADCLFLDTMYKICRKLTAFYWKGTKFDNLAVFGNMMLQCFRNNSIDEMNRFESAFSQRALSVYTENIYNNKADIMTTVRNLENMYSICTNSTEKDVFCFTAGYTFSDKRDFWADGKCFEDIRELTGYCEKLMTSAFPKFKKFCNNLTADNGVLKPQFEAWLKISGYSEVIVKWKEANYTEI